jgi:hypothetical protein
MVRSETVQPKACHRALECTVALTTKEHIMQYKATIETQTKIVYAYGTTDHEAIMRAITEMNKLDPHQTLVTVCHAYSNDETPVFADTLYGYMESIG